jgi:peptide/nickel transport system permease protein
MVQFVVRRLLFTGGVLFLISLAIFVVTELLPGDAAYLVLGKDATSEKLTLLRSQMGLDRPPSERYLGWLGGILQGDWGESMILRRPVWPLLQQRLANSARLALLAWPFSVFLGVGLGLAAGLHANRWLDRVISALALFAVSIPSFVLAVLLILCFSIWLQWLPAASMLAAESDFWGSLRFFILPTLVLTVISSTEVVRIVRLSVIEVMHQDYIRTAKGKGLPAHTLVWHHALRNALLPAISVLALNLAFLLGGVVVVESVFAYPGMGRLLLQAVTQRDLPLLQAVALVSAALFALINLVADLVVFSLNPRLRSL